MDKSQVKTNGGIDKSDTIMYNKDEEGARARHTHVILRANLSF